MAEITAFKGYRYLVEKPEGLGAFTAPPYDMIDPAMVDELYARDPHNVVRIIQNRPEPSDTANIDRHRRAAGLLREWTAAGILRQDPSRALYVYRQRFNAGISGSFVRTGITVLLKVTDYDDGVVLPHEYTLTGPKKDRYELLESTRFNPEQVFGIVPDEDGRFHETVSAAVTRRPDGVFTDADAVVHELYMNADAGLADRVRSVLADRKVLIADGHHRYETSLAYRNNTGTAGSDYIMVTLVSMADPGLVILPFHRLIKRGASHGRWITPQTLSAFFTVTPLDDGSLDRVIDALQKRNEFEFFYRDAETGTLFGLAINDQGRAYLAAHGENHTATWTGLTVSKINLLCVQGILGLELDGKTLHDAVDYVKDVRNAHRKALDKSDYQCAFFIRPVGIGTVRDIVSHGERMPQKSTNFFPKLHSGLVMRALDER